MFKDRCRPCRSDATQPKHKGDKSSVSPNAKMGAKLDFCFVCLLENNESNTGGVFSFKVQPSLCRQILSMSGGQSIHFPKH